LVAQAVRVGAAVQVEMEVYSHSACHPVITWGCTAVREGRVAPGESEAKAGKVVPVGKAPAAASSSQRDSSSSVARKSILTARSVVPVVLAVLAAKEAREAAAVAEARAQLGSP
jgi:hypothetical protein